MPSGYTGSAIEYYRIARRLDQWGLLKQNCHQGLKRADIKLMIWMHSRLLHTEFTDTSRVHSTVTFNCVKSFFGAYAWRQMGHWIFLTKCRSLPLHFVHNSFFFVTESSVKTYLSKVSYLNLTYLKKTIHFRGSLQGETISVTITTNILISLKYYGLLRIGKTGLCAILGTEVLACSWRQWAVIVMRNTEGERTGMTKVNSYSVLNWHFTKKEIWSKCHTHTQKKSCWNFCSNSENDHMYFYVTVS